MAAELSLSDINGRFRFIERPFPLPGKCAVCGNVQTPVVDFGATVDGYGAILICQTCVTQAFGLLVKVGVVEVPQPVPVEAYVEASAAIKDDVNVAVASIRGLLDAFVDLNNAVSGEVAQGEPEPSSGAGGKDSSGSKGSDKSPSSPARDKGPSRLSSSSDGAGIAGL